MVKISPPKPVKTNYMQQSLYETPKSEHINPNPVQHTPHVILNIDSISIYYTVAIV